MVSSAAPTVASYLRSLPVDRRRELALVRRLVKQHLPRGYVEVMQHGMISWIVPPRRTPATYNGQPLVIAALAAQKNQASLYLMGLYVRPPVGKVFARAVRAMPRVSVGKSCVRFVHAMDLDPDAVADVLGAIGVEDLVTHHDKTHAGRRLQPIKARQT